MQLVPLELDLRTAESQRAAAAEAVEQQVFAVLLPERPVLAPTPNDFFDRASRGEVISIESGTTQTSSTAMSALSPYDWSYQAGLDVLQQSAADLVCEVLAGRRATLSPEQSRRQRHLGVIVADAAHAGGDDFDVQTLADSLQRCHVTPQVQRVDPTSQASMGEAIGRLKAGGVTTVLPYLAASTVAGLAMPQAEAHGYRPEWLLAGVDDDPAESTWSTAPAKQLRALAGLVSWQRATLPPARQAAANGVVDQAAYRALLLLASGIQLAGPRLTPDSLNNGLSTAAFPNPGAGGRPLYQARVGFDDLDHAMVDDIALARWRSSGFCLVDGGVRWVLGNLPKNDPGLIDPATECS